jgi:hypothetical protein
VSSERNTESNTGMVMSGVIIMLTACLVIITVDLNMQRWVGIILLALIGLGLCVAGSPDPRKDNDADSM